MATRYFKAVFVPSTPLPTRGSATWTELHTYQPKGIPFDDQFIEDFSRRVTESGCSCQSHWRVWLRVHPVRWDDFFVWTVEAHNAVNARLGKRQLPLDEARTEQARHSFNLT